jgi:hypothetical protein
VGLIQFSGEENVITELYFAIPEYMEDNGSRNKCVIKDGNPR